MRSEHDRKAAYRLVAQILSFEIGAAATSVIPRELRGEVERIRDAMRAAGNVPELAAEGLVLQ